MNILVFSWRDLKHPLAGGAEQVMHEHMRGWVRAGNKVTLFSSRFKDSSPGEEINGIEITRKGNQYHLGVQVAAFVFYLKNKNYYDLVVDQFHGMPFFTPLYSSKPKIAVIQEVAREVWFMNHFPFPLNWIYGAFGYFLEPIVFQFYKKTPFMTGSASAADELVAFGVPKEIITTVPHGVIIYKLKQLPDKEKTETVSFLGALTRDKGIEDAIKTFGILNKRGDYKFWIIGKGDSDYVDSLKKLVKKLGIGGKTQFWGFVSIEKKFELLARSHILINPSVREGWGLVNIEANAVGTPVIAYNSPGLIDSVKNKVSGLICGENTPEDMASKVKALLEDNKLYAQLQKGAVRWANKFNWERSKKLSLELIKRIAHDR